MPSKLVQETCNWTVNYTRGKDVVSKLKRRYYVLREYAKNVKLRNEQQKRNITILEKQVEKQNQQIKRLKLRTIHKIIAKARSTGKLKACYHLLKVSEKNFSASGMSGNFSRGTGG